MKPKYWGWILAIATVVLVTWNQRDEGIARDEIVYMGAASHYVDWWTHPKFSHDEITKAFGGKAPTDNNREHPPLMKELFGFSKLLLHDKLGIAGELTAYRFPNALMAGLLVLLVFTMTLEIWGLGAAAIASLACVLLPRALFHAGLACFDAPMTTTWFLVVYAYWRGLESTIPWKVGVAFGLALATKHNAILIPFAIAPHLAYVIYRTRQWRRLLVIPTMAILGPLTLIALWPWLWFDTAEHIRQWLAFHMTHVHYNFEYLGHNWNAPKFPWHVALVTTLFTVPTVTLVAALFGVFAWLRERIALPESSDRDRAPALLLFLSAGVSMGPFLLGTTPIFGAEKHWAPAITSICIAAGVGTWFAVTRARQLVRGDRAKRTLAFAIGAAIVVPAAVETFTAQPYALTSYTALAGGAPGGADLGMNRQFWGVSARGVLDVLPRLADPKAKSTPVYSHDASPAWSTYIKLGMLSNKFPDSGQEQYGIDASRLALVIHELHFDRHDFMIWKAYQTVQPAYVLRDDGVPIVSVYRRRQ